MTVESLHKRVSDVVLKSDNVSVWGVQNYIDELVALAESMDRPLNWCAQRFGTVTVPSSEAGWLSHPALGFWKAK